MNSGDMERINGLKDYKLADLAGCQRPSAEGATFLESVRDEVVERFTFHAAHADDPDVSAPDWEAVCNEIAQGAPDVMTAERWLEFVDLGAYAEVPEGEGWGSKDLTEIAAEALSQIAYRLAGALMTCNETGEILTECVCVDHAPVCPRCGIRERHVAGGNLCRELGGR